MRSDNNSNLGAETDL